MEKKEPIRSSVDVFIERGLGKEIFYPVFATAIEPVAACFIELEFFIATLKVNHDYTFKLLMFSAEELQESERRMRNMAHMSVKGRVVYGLLRLKEKFGVSDEGFLNISLTRQDLASYAGTTYETAFRVLTELSKENLISLVEKEILIIDEVSLENELAK